jgi:predicted MFS family arabinose efflux permease
MPVSRSVAWSAWAVASAFYAWQYVLRVMPNIMLPDLQKQFHMDAALFGQFSGAWYLGYCLMHLPTGLLLDRYGPRRVMPVCILLTSLGILPVAVSTSPALAVAGRFLVGVGSSAAILGAFRIIRAGFREQQFSSVLSLCVTVGLAGALWGGVPVSLLCQSFGYTAVTGAGALTGCVLALLAWWLTPVVPDAAETGVSPWHSVRQVLAHPRVMGISLLAGLMVGPLEGFSDAWGSEFLVQVCGFSYPTAHTLTSLVYVGMGLAPLLVAWTSRRGFCPFRTIAVMGVVMAAVFALLVSGKAGLKTATAGLFLTGFCCSYQILAVVQAARQVLGHLASLATAVANMVIMSFGYFFHSAIGLIVHMPVHSSPRQALLWGVSLIPFTLIAGSAGFFWTGTGKRHPGVPPLPKARP